MKEPSLSPPRLGERGWLRAAFALGVLIALGMPTSSLCAQEPNRRFPPGTRVEIDGDWNGQRIEVSKLVIEEPDAFPEVKGFLSAVDLGKRTISIPPFTIEVTVQTDIDDDDVEGESYRLDELQPEWRLKIEGKLVGPRRFRAFQIDVETQPAQRGQVELEAYVEEESLDGGEHVITVLGIPCLITAETEVPAGIFRKAARRQVDDDEQRPVDQLVLFDRLTVGGEVQLDLDYEDDFDLNSRDNQDILALGYSATLELLFDINPQMFLFSKGRVAEAFVIFDEDEDKDFDERTALEELYWQWNQIGGSGVSSQVGRQDFDDKREWLYDENLDAARFYWRPGQWEFEYSVSTFLADPPRRRGASYKDRIHNIGSLRYFINADTWLEAYFIDIQDSSDVDDSPFFTGLRAIGRPTRSILYWADYSYVDGVDGFDRVEAHALDFGGGYHFRNTILRPYFFAGYAFGTGDGQKGGRTDRNYRQTGYQDNNDKFFGVTSYRYYGELLRPELSNLHIGTAGMGIRPVEWLSVDVLYHWYRQDHRSAELRDAKIDASPTGLSRDIGQEFDLVFGLDKIAGHLDVEVDVGYFVPGSAFDPDDHPALWVAVQLEWNF